MVGYKKRAQYLYYGKKVANAAAVKAASQLVGYAAKRAAGKVHQMAGYGSKNSLPRNPRSVKQVKGAYKKVLKKEKSLQKQVKELKRVAESDMGTHIHRRRDTGKIASAACAQVTTSLEMNNSTLIEEALAQLRYYNSSTPGTLVTADGTSGTYQKEFYFKRSYAKIRFRNNYQVPVRIKVMVMTPKGDTSFSPSSCYSNGLADVGNPTNTSLLVYPTDSVQLTDLWKTSSSINKVLMPGRECVVSYSGKPYQYDPSLYDNHNLTYQSRFQSAAALIRIEGVLGHDTTVSTEQNVLQGGVDYERIVSYEIRYSAGADIRYIYVSDNGDASFTNAGVVTMHPLSDNTFYSVG